MILKGILLENIYVSSNNPQKILASGLRLLGLEICDFQKESDRKINSCTQHFEALASNPEAASLAGAKICISDVTHAFEGLCHS